MNIVIGTGVAGISAAKALVRNGQRVLIFDTGLLLEDENEKMKVEIGSLSKEEWSADLLKRYTKGVKTEGTNVTKKLVYGSNYVYSNLSQSLNVHLMQAKMVRSYARGGFSNVWGACTLPYPADELSDWPISSFDLAPYYKHVLSFLPISAERDGLMDRFPLYSSSFSALKRSAQAEALYLDLCKSRERLNENGIQFGASRLAVNNRGEKCSYCGLCLYGCPYELIYSADHTLKELLGNPLVTYFPNVYVKKLEEKNDTVTVYYSNIDNKELKSLNCEKVFIAAGIIETARIMLESLEAYEKPLFAKHSDRFVLPFFRFKGSDGVEKNSYHTLSQIFLELTNRNEFQNDVHLQVYGYNDLLLKAIQQILGKFYKPFSFPTKKLIEHLFIMFGYIHSDQSSGLIIKLKKGSENSLEIEGVPNTEAKKICKKVMKKLALNCKNLGGVPVWTFLDPPGGGNHTGGTFPMSDNPINFQTDILGRLPGLKRIHIVDSSTFPSLPAATIVLTSMANSYRIADLTCQ